MCLSAAIAGQTIHITKLKLSFDNPYQVTNSIKYNISIINININDQYYIKSSHNSKLLHEINFRKFLTWSKGNAFRFTVAVSVELVYASFVKWQNVPRSPYLNKRLQGYRNILPEVVVNSIIVLFRFRDRGRWIIRNTVQYNSRLWKYWHSDIILIPIKLTTNHVTSAVPGITR